MSGVAPTKLSTTELPRFASVALDLLETEFRPLVCTAKEKLTHFYRTRPESERKVIGEGYVEYLRERENQWNNEYQKILDDELLSFEIRNLSLQQADSEQYEEQKMRHLHTIAQRCWQNRELKHEHWPNEPVEKQVPSYCIPFSLVKADNTFHQDRWLEVLFSGIKDEKERQESKDELVDPVSRKINITDHTLRIVSEKERQKSKDELVDPVSRKINFTDPTLRIMSEDDKSSKELNQFNQNALKYLETRCKTILQKAGLTCIPIALDQKEEHEKLVKIEKQNRVILLTHSLTESYFGLGQVSKILGELDKIKPRTNLPPQLHERRTSDRIYPSAEKYQFEVMKEAITKILTLHKENAEKKSPRAEHTKPILFKVANLTPAEVETYSRVAKEFFGILDSVFRSLSEFTALAKIELDIDFLPEDHFTPRPELNHSKTTYTRKHSNIKQKVGTYSEGPSEAYQDFKATSGHVDLFEIIKKLFNEILVFKQ